MFAAVDAAFPDGEKILVEVFSLIRDHSPVEELVTAITNSRQWRGRVQLKVTRLDEWPEAATPYGTITANTVVVRGDRVLPKPDYWTLQKALEECAG